VRRTFTALVVVLVSGIATALPGGNPAVADPSAPAPSAVAQRAAERALHRAQSLLQPRSSTLRSRTTEPRSASTVDATGALRDLALRTEDLTSAADTRAARGLLSRPTDGGVQGPGEPTYTGPVGVACTATVCVHWVENDANAPTGSDGNVATVEPWVRSTLATVDAVYARETGSLGYRVPVTDAAAADNGGDGRLDIYLAEVGDQGIFGYCTPDDPNPSAKTVYGYCVLDNDYDPAEFGGTRTPTQSLQVTAAHELFHLIQFAYDWTEDLWLMEGTATWMEDELYDSVDDNRRYLQFSPLALPDEPVDFADETYAGYGAWIFWRFLTEWQRPSGAASDPTLVRQVWDAAGGSASSLFAVKGVLAARHTTLGEALAGFGVWNRTPGQHYSEGRAYAGAPSIRTKMLGRSSRKDHTRSTVLYHLGQKWVQYRPASSLRGHWRLRITVDMPATYRGSRAQVLIRRTNGHLAVYPIRLKSSGSGTRVVGFDRRRVVAVDLQLVDASSRYHCGRNTYLACAGIPLDDSLRTTYRAEVVR
jgi:hypothetical protein